MSDLPSPGFHHSFEFEKVKVKGRRVKSRLSDAHKKMVCSIEKRTSRNASEETNKERHASNYLRISRSPNVNRLERQKAVRVNGLAAATESGADDMQDVEEVVRELLSVSGLDSSLLEDPHKKKEVYNFVKKNEVARAVTMRRRTVSENSTALGGLSGNLTPRTNREEETITSEYITPPTPPPPPPPPLPSVNPSRLTARMIETQYSEGLTSDQKYVRYTKPGNSLA